ncbi:hypothetical protein [Nitratireductor sp. XY-223]|uniref:hypothetical protein n=1 Tax=Nitratireductor sp. XY-223 TaxID=2561926 RepID=UPI0010AACC93|nr:hypothetical protein [Nitratireductor sp. XY-223]
MRMFCRILFAFLLAAAPLNALAEQIPPHLAAMAAQLYKGVEAELQNPNVSPERRRILEEADRTLRQMGVHRWSSRSAKIDSALPAVAGKLGLDPATARDRETLETFMSGRSVNGTEAALQALEIQTNRPISEEERYQKAVEIDEAIGEARKDFSTDYVSTRDDGRAVRMQWKPGTGKFAMKVVDDGAGDSEEFAATFSGDVDETVSENGQDVTLGVQPSRQPLQAITQEDIEFLRGNILGEWTEKRTGEIYVFEASDQKIGEVLPPGEVFDDRIAQIKDRIKSIRSAKVFQWENPKTGEVVKQETYRRLKEPYEFVGEEYALEDAEEKMAALEGEIAALEKERDGGNLLPRDKHDPVGFEEFLASGDGRPIKVTVTRPDGYSYTYDEALFDGRRIAAKRTYTDLMDLTNERLPDRIKKQLIDNGWNPPGWLDLDASIDAETGDLVLEGGKWSLKVTYSAFFGDPPDVDRIHSPWSSGRLLSKEGADYEVAEGAASDFVP